MDAFFFLIMLYVVLLSTGVLEPNNVHVHVACTVESILYLYKYDLYLYWKIWTANASVCDDQLMLISHNYR